MVVRASAIKGMVVTILIMYVKSKNMLICFVCSLFKIRQKRNLSEDHVCLALDVQA